MRGQPLGDSAASRLVRANIRRNAGEWRDRMLVWTRNNVFPHNTSTFPSSKLKASRGTAAVGSSMRSSLSEVSGMVVSMGGSSSEVSAIVKSDRVAMLIDGDRMRGDPGIVSVSGMTAGSSGGGRGIWGSGSLFGSPRDVATGVAARSFWSTPADFGILVVNAGGGGRPSQPCPRNATSS